MSRKEFSASVKREAWKRSGGFCEVHRLPHVLGLPDSCDRVAAELDHIEPCVLGGDATLENSAYLCRHHHRQKSDRDVADKSTRNKHAVKKGRPKPGWFKSGRKLQSKGFNSEYTRKVSGETVKRTRKRRKTKANPA